MMRPSLLQKLIVLFLGIFLCSAGALTYLAYESSRNAILLEFNIRGRELAKALASELRDNFEQEDVEGLTTHLQSIGDAEGVLAILTYKNTQELWIESSIIDMTEKELRLSQPQDSWQFNQVLSKGAQVREFGNSVISIPSAPSSQAMINTTPLGWVTILLDRTPLQNRLNELLVNILTSSALIILSGGLLFVVLLRHSLKIIPPLIEATQRVGKGELTTMVPVTTHDDLGQLTTLFNEMTAQLHKTTVSKNYVDNIIQSMMDTLIVVDPQGIIRTANQAARRLLGYEESELVGKPFSLIFRSDRTEARQDLLQDILRKGTMSHIETTYIHKSGRTIPVLFSSAVLYHEWQQPQGIACLGQDITERNKAADLIQFSHGLLEAIHGAQDRFLAAQDPHTIFQELLEVVLKLTNSEIGFIGEVLLSPEKKPFLRTHAITNLSWNETGTGHFTQAVPNLEFHDLRNLFGEAILTGKPTIANHPDTDLRWGNLPKVHPPLTAFLGLPFFSGEKLVGILALGNHPGGFQTDLIEHLQPILSTCGNLVEAYQNEQRRAAIEAALRASVERFDVAVQGSRDGLWDAWVEGPNPLDPNTGVYYSPRFKALLGYHDHEFPNVMGSWLDSLYSDDREKAIQDLQAHLHEHVPYDSEYRMTTKTGAIRWYAGRGQAIWNEHDQPVRIAGSFSDITARKNAEQELQSAHVQLQRLDRLRTQFFADISHELRTPLTVIRGEAEVTLRGKKEKPIKEYTSALEQIIQSTSELDKLVNDLLFLARSETGTIQVHKERCPLVEIFKEILHEATVLARKKQIEIVFPSLDKGCILFGDPQRLKQLFLIILDNAVKYSPRHSHIEMRFARHEHQLEFQITDTGIGIPSMDIDNVFERFFRVKQLTSDNPGGAGLGLPIAKWITEVHEGKISITSKPGEGTTVTIILPLTAD